MKKKKKNLKKRKKLPRKVVRKKPSKKSKIKNRKKSNKPKNKYKKKVVKKTKVLQRAKLISFIKIKEAKIKIHPTVLKTKCLIKLIFLKEII